MSRAQQTIHLQARINPVNGSAFEGQAPGTIWFWVNGLFVASKTYVPDPAGTAATLPKSTIALANISAPNIGLNRILDGALHEVLITAGLLNGSDIAADHAYVKAKYGSRVGQTGNGYLARAVAGQSCAQGAVGTSPSGGSGGTGGEADDYSFLFGDGLLRRVLQTPHVRDESLHGAYNTYLAAHALLQSNAVQNYLLKATWTSGSPTMVLADTSRLAADYLVYASTAPTVAGSGIPANTTIKSVDSATQITLSANATATVSTATSCRFQAVTAKVSAVPSAWIDDINSGATDDPSTWKLNTTAGSAGQTTYPFLASLPASVAAVLWILRWRQGEDDANYSTAASGYNWNALSVYSGQTVRQRAAEYQKGMTKHVGLMRQQTGSSILRLVVYHLGGKLANGTGDYFRAAMIDWIDQNPGLGILLSGNPIQVYINDNTSPPHWTPQGWFTSDLQGARVEGYEATMNGGLPADARGRFTYGQHPRITGITANAGDSFITVKVSNSNGAKTLKTLSLFAQEVWISGKTYASATFAGTTTSAFGASTIEETGYEFQTATLAKETLQSITLGSDGWSYKLGLAAPLVSGQIVTHFYGREGATVLKTWVAADGSSPGYMAQITDDAGTACPPEPGALAPDRFDMALQINPKGFKVTLA